MPKRPLILFGIMSLATVGGPLLIALVLGGGTSPRWPPDRPIEWWTLGLVVATFLALMAASIATALLDRPATPPAPPRPDDAPKA